MRRFWTPDRLETMNRVVAESSSLAEAAATLGRMFNKRIRPAALANVVYNTKDELPLQVDGASIRVPPDVKLPVKELIADRNRRFLNKQKHEDHRKLIPVTLRENKPIGILHFGDPHLDDDGTDLSVVQAHAELVRNTPGLYGATVGDMNNNWIGRLAHLYGQQTTTESEAWQLAEWFVRLVRKWLYIVGGNHDAWSGVGDPLKWIAREENALYQESEVRLALRFPKGPEVRINCRHDFAGSSIYNPAHGPMKAAIFGTRDHLLICGDKHVSAYGVLKDPETGITMHTIRVASYKQYDRYAREKGFRDQNLSPCCLTTIDPRLPATHPDLIKTWWDAHEGAAYLTWLRNRPLRKAA